MIWKGAIKKSKINIAIRKTKDGRIIYRYKDGSADIQLHKKNLFRRAETREIEGYGDWLAYNKNELHLDYSKERDKND